ncbi:ankyrin [Cucurbitaria berberidis CBS 394.84]|uniref:Ankyrin n=1 Tax=Cucurbitaria berberidis CBS 394.84 TaxID=1168544 RepID=A0A9P4LDL7_9PLEO|nr:ankyrin [Cucurbitaria berberidis CBS 394.84]KAF1851150.1 ankyrin [Cucurbitaria berberidis CBS 394.84]
MGLPNLPKAVASAIASGDAAQLKDLYQPNNMTLEDIATHAAARGKPSIMQWCCDQGWRPPRESFNSNFVSHAVYGESPSIFQILIDNGLDLNAHENELHGDPLASAVENGNYNFAKWLLEHGHRSTPNDSIFGDDTAIVSTIYADRANQEMLKLLLDHGHDLENTGAGVVAAEEGNVEALRLLLDRGLNVEERRRVTNYGTADETYDTEGTALYHACKQGNEECVELLLQRGANPLAEDLNGRSCLDIARQGGDDYEYIVWLLENSGSVNSASAAQTLLGFIKRLFFF